jgi:hypothetical protein
MRAMPSWGDERVRRVHKACQEAAVSWYVAPGQDESAADASRIPLYRRLAAGNLTRQTKLVQLE